MIECYFKWCDNHAKTEPYCANKNCTKNSGQIIAFITLLKNELKEINKQENENAKI